LNESLPIMLLEHTDLTPWNQPVDGILMISCHPRTLDCQGHYLETKMVWEYDFASLANNVTFRDPGFSSYPWNVFLDSP
jgi:hypothetical protein